VCVSVNTLSKKQNSGGQTLQWRRFLLSGGGTGSGAPGQGGSGVVVFFYLWERIHGEPSLPSALLQYHSIRIRIAVFVLCSKR